MTNNLRIIFMGTPEFAVESLRRLVENKCKVVAVITSPDKPAGRGLKLSYSPVKEYALSVNLPILQPEKLKNTDFLEELKGYRADLQIVVAFRMLPEVVWNMPLKGTFNLHASLLPQYRGAAPINWAIINGEVQTGISTFFLQHEIDTGNLIFQEQESILPSDDVGTLYQRLMHKGADLVLKTTQAIAQNAYPQVLQPQVEWLKTAPKIFKETCQIQWNKPTIAIHNLVRGLSPYPAAWFIFKEKTFKVFAANPIALPDEHATCGDYVTDHKSFLAFRTADGWLNIIELQPEGKRRMPIGDFLRGIKSL